MIIILIIVMITAIILIIVIISVALPISCPPPLSLPTSIYSSPSFPFPCLLSPHASLPVSVTSKISWVSLSPPLSLSIPMGRHPNRSYQYADGERWTRRWTWTCWDDRDWYLVNVEIEISVNWGPCIYIYIYIHMFIMMIMIILLMQTWLIKVVYKTGTDTSRRLRRARGDHPELLLGRRGSQGQGLRAGARRVQSMRCKTIHIHIHTYTYIHIYIYIYTNTISLSLSMHIYIYMFVCMSACVRHASTVGCRQRSSGSTTDLSILYHSILYYTILYYTTLYYTILNYNYNYDILYYTITITII